jgi:hypothetical protein
MIYKYIFLPKKTLNIHEEQNKDERLSNLSVMSIEKKIVEIVGFG